MIKLAKTCVICGKELKFSDPKCVTKDHKYVCKDDTQKFFNDKVLTFTGIKLKAAETIAELDSNEIIETINSGKKFSINSRLHQIEEKLDKVKTSKLVGVKPAIKMLPEVLNENETINCATSGQTKTDMWLILSTNQRFLAVSKDYLTLKNMDERIIQIPLDKVNDLSAKSGMVFGKLYISNGVQKYKFGNMANNEAKSFVNALQEQINNNEGSKQITVNQTIDPADEIAKFKKLLDAGAITKEEYDKKKKQLLGF